MLVLIPIALPIGALVVRVLGASGDAASVLFSQRTLELLARSALLTALVTVAAIVIGVGAAWITVRTDLRGRTVWGVLVAMPLVIPSYVIALSFLSASGPRGLLARITGVAQPVLDGLPGAWLALTLSTFPYVFLIVAAALRRIDPALEDAARGLGASQRRVFRTITLPQLRPAIGAGALLVALYTLSDFGAVSLMRFDAFTRVIYAQYAGRLDRTPAAVLSLALIGIALVIIWAEGRTRGSATYFAHRPKRTATVRHLSRPERAVATIALGSVVVAGLVLPVLVLVAWVADGGGLAIASMVNWERGGRIAPRIVARCGGCHGRGNPCRRARRSLPQPGVGVARAVGLRGILAPPHHRRHRRRVLLGPLPRTLLPVVDRAGCGVRHRVPGPGDGLGEGVAPSGRPGGRGGVPGARTRPVGDPALGDHSL